MLQARKGGANRRSAFAAITRAAVMESSLMRGFRAVPKTREIREA
jgi:hypothetical protein